MSKIESVCMLETLRSTHDDSNTDLRNISILIYYYIFQENCLKFKRKLAHYYMVNSVRDSRFAHNTDLMIHNVNI